MGFEAITSKKKQSQPVGRDTKSIVTDFKWVVRSEVLRFISWGLKCYLLLFPRPTPPPARSFRRWLVSGRRGRRLFGPTVTHACVCPPALESVGIKAWRSGLEGFKRRRAEYQELGGKNDNESVQQGHFKYSYFCTISRVSLNEGWIDQNHAGRLSRSRRGNCSHTSPGTRLIGAQTGLWQMQGNMRVVCRD